MNQLSKLTLAIALTIATATVTLANAAKHVSNLSAGAIMLKSEGEIKKVDKDAGKVTIKHGELKNLKMPAMTMAFRVKDLAMLDHVKVGDKIKFVDGQPGGQFIATQLEVQQ